MEWVIIIVLAIMVVWFFSQYWRGLRVRSNLESLYIRILLDEELYQERRSGLISFAYDQ